MVMVGSKRRTPIAVGTVIAVLSLGLAELNERYFRSHWAWHASRGVITGLFEPTSWMVALLASAWGQLFPFVMGFALALARATITQDVYAVAAMFNGIAVLVASAFSNVLVASVKHMLSVSAGVMFAVLAYQELAAAAQNRSLPGVDFLAKVPQEVRLAVPLILHSTASGGVGNVVPF
jgi:hypothetical protein